MLIFLLFLFCLSIQTLNAQFNIQAEIDKVKNGGVVNIPAGTYVIDSRLVFYQARGITVNAKNAKIIVSDKVSNKQAIIIENSDNIIINDLEIDYQTLPFTQGVVTQIGSDNSWFDVRIHSGYPTDSSKFPSGSFVHVFDPTTRQFKQEAALFDGIQSTYNHTSIGSGIIRVNVKVDEAGYRNLKVNDLVAIASSLDFNCAVNLYNTRTTQLNRVIVYSAPGCAVIENSGSGTVIDGFTIKRGTPPSGATEQRLLSVNRDGLHLNGPKGGSIIKNCLIEFCGDDAVNIRSAFAEVTKVDKQQNYIEFKPSYTHFTPPTSLHIYSGQKLADKGYATATSHALGVGNAIVSSAGNIEVGDRFVAPDHSQGFKIMNNTFRDVDGRGVVAGGLDIYIEGNNIDRTTMAGIWVGGEFYHFQEGDFANNVYIRWNKLNDCGYSWRARHQDMQILGAISIANEIPPSKVMDMRWVRQNRRTWVVENTVQRPGLAALYIAHMVNASICRNNFFSTNFLNPRDAGSKIPGISNTMSRHSIVVHDATQVRTYLNWVTTGTYSLSMKDVTESDTVDEVAFNPCASI